MVFLEARIASAYLRGLILLFLTPWGNAVLAEKVPHAWAFVHHAGGTHRPAAAPTYPGNPLQYYCLEKSTVRGAWWVIVHGVAKSWTRLSTAKWGLF